MLAQMQYRKSMVTINAPASKSYAQRAIAASMLAHGVSVVRGVGASDDVMAASGIACAMGANVELRHGDLYITGCKPAGGVINVHESGLSTRLFAPIAALSAAPTTINGSGSILKRPMGMIVDALRALGVEVVSNNGFLPLTIGGGMLGGGVMEIDGSVSSQLLTGLLTALPLVANDTQIVVANLQSKPYIDITIDVLRNFGVEIVNDNYERFFIRGGQKFTPCDFTVEGDWSGASCMLVAAAIFGGLEVANLNYNSVQADIAILGAIKQAGSELNAIKFDATHCPDLFPALVALAAHCRGVSVIEGTSRLAYKESDRAVALQSEFGKLGIEVDISTPNVMKVTGGDIESGAHINTHGDHRIAMATAIAALGKYITFDNKAVVDKSYPDFWVHRQAIEKMHIAVNTSER